MREMRSVSGSCRTAAHRGDAVKDAAAQALVYGGNESCEACHAEVNEKVASLAHSGLSCESCHGALGDHVEGGKKVAAAPVDKTMWQCLNCHEERINRPEDLPQFPGDVGRHEDIEEGTTCYKCHDAHDPTP